jgi:thymidylate synthase ThyX
MAYAARVLLDSVSEAGIRLTTMEVTFPRFVLAEFNTHRQFSRNSASSRAIPTTKMLERVDEDPVFPVEWGRNQKGMSASDVLTPEDEEEARRAWLDARDAAVEQAQRLSHLRVHKQVVNRLLEPFLWHTVIVTATEWSNFFDLRCAPNAQPELRQAAILMRNAMAASKPQLVKAGNWHLPLLQSDETGLDLETKKKISVARCARVSYLTHAGTREIEKDLELFDRLRADRHLSPFEHVATPANDVAFHANFRGWIQMRQEIEGAHQ